MSGLGSGLPLNEILVARKVRAASRFGSIESSLSFLASRSIFSSQLQRPHVSQQWQRGHSTVPQVLHLWQYDEVLEREGVRGGSGVVVGVTRSGTSSGGPHDRSLRQHQMRYEERIVIFDMRFRSHFRCELLKPSLDRNRRVEWATHPRDPTSKVKSWTVHPFLLHSSTSERSFFLASDLEYLLNFLMDAASMFSSRGTVYSPQITILADLE